MRIACWIPKATNTRSEYATLIAFSLQMVTQKCLDVTFTRALPVLFKDLLTLQNKIPSQLNDARPIPTSEFCSANTLILMPRNYYLADWLAQR